MARRDAGDAGGAGGAGGAGDAGGAGRSYVTSAPDGTVPDVILRWERAVHDPGVYDMEVDTSRTSPAACAAAIAGRMAAGPATAFAELATPRI